jgi:hypothetical protein
MKYFAVLLIGCILFLSSFSGMVDISPATAKMDCYKIMTGKDACHHKAAKDEGGACEKPGCPMLFSCSMCGFIPVAALKLPSSILFLLKQPVPLYKSGNMTEYHKADWKPPKAC